MPDDSIHPSQPAQSDQTVSFSGRYLVIVGGLLVLVIAMLAYLWTKERSRRLDVERAFTEYQAKAEADKRNIAQMMLSQIGRPGAEESAVRPFQRQDHVPATVTLDGEKRQAFHLPAAAGERFGFQGGDVIVVERAPAKSTAPASGAERSSVRAGGRLIGAVGWRVVCGPYGPPVGAATHDSADFVCEAWVASNSDATHGTSAAVT